MEEAGTDAELPEGMRSAGVAGVGDGSMAAGRSRILPPSVVDGPWLASKANIKVHTKKIKADAAVERDKKLALPVAPNKLPEAPAPKDTPMSAPFPC